jgi:integrase
MEPARGISLEIYWLSSPCRLSQEHPRLREKARNPMAKSHLALVAPATVIGTVEPHRRPPKRVVNAEVRAREYLTNAEVDRLIKAAGANRNGHRDATMVLVAYRHGLRPVELVTLRWDAIDFAHGQIHVSRAKNGAPSVHPLSGVELRALRRLKRDQEPPSPFVFTSERGVPFTTAGWRKMVARPGVAAKLGFKAHPHMFRHACGFQLANQGTGHAHPTGISRPSKHSAHRALHRTVADALQEPLARLTPTARSLPRKLC